MPHITVQEAFRLAREHHQAGQLADAETLYRRILAADPNHAGAMHLLGALAHETGHHEDAVDWIRRSVALAPGDASAHSNLGEALFALGCTEDALAHFRRSVELDPHMAVAHFNLANVLRFAGRLDEAEAGYRRALALGLDDGKVHNNLAGALAEQGRFEEAIAAYQDARRRMPGEPSIQSSLICLRRVTGLGGNEAMLEELRYWNRQFAEPLRGTIQPHANGPEPDRRLRIGYVSPDFRVHAELFFLEPLLREHDRQQFEIHCFASVARPDAGTECLRRLADAWHDVRSLPDEELAATIRGAQIDILVDLAMHTSGNRLLLFARKPAPVQVAWLAYPGGTRLETMDHRITDGYLDPPLVADSMSSEAPVRLPHSWCCYHSILDDGAVNVLPALTAGHITFGCLSNFLKFNDETLVRFAAVLSAVENSRLILLAPEGSARQRLADRFAECGIARERVEYVAAGPRAEYLRRYHRIDIALDTFPHNNMAGTCETLWMGVPVISLAGQSPVSRAGLSLLSTVGLSDLVAHTSDEFIAIARRLSGDLASLAALRSGMRPRLKTSPLMDAPRFARNMETVYRQMWRRWCAGSANRKETR
jgi:predicted O-linked N-acetylglucosamine transferase (SPINDLY family)